MIPTGLSAPTTIPSHRPWSEIEAERLNAIEEWNREIRKFLAKQQPLGKEFEQVLYDNLWELYVRS